LFPAVEAALMGQILVRDAEFYRPSIPMDGPAISKPMVEDGRVVGEKSKGHILIFWV
jgi:hypothetical protein